MPYKVYYGTLKSGGLGSVDHYDWNSRTLMYDSSATEDSENYLLEPMLIREANAAGSFEADVPHSNTCWSSLQLILGTVEVERDGEIIWQGRITEMTMDFDLNIHIYCEGELAYLNDHTVAIDWSKIRAEHLDEDETPTGMYEYNAFYALNEYCSCDINSNGKAITWKFDNFEGLDENEQLVEALGMMAIMAMTIDPNGQVDDSVYVNSFDFLINTVLGGMLAPIDGYVYIIMDREHDSNGYKRVLKLMCLDWTEGTLSEYPYEGMVFGRTLRKITNQRVEFGSNITDIKISRKIDNLKTYARVFGYETKGWWIFSSTNTIVGTAFNRDLMNKYGQIEAISSIEGTATTLEKLDTAAESLIGTANNGIFEEIEVSAIDLVDAGVDTDRLDFMKFSNVSSPPHGLEKLMLCVKLEEPLDDPSKKVFTFGRKKNLITKEQSSIGSTAQKSYGMSKNIKSYVTTS